jgi:hypothetical protein
MVTTLALRTLGFKRRSSEIDAAAAVATPFINLQLEPSVFFVALASTKETTPKIGCIRWTMGIELRVTHCIPKAYEEVFFS